MDVVNRITSIQIDHLFQIAREMNLENDVHAALGRMVIASIGPTTSEALEEFGLKPDLEPSHPKMGFLVKETAEQAADILAAKRGADA